MTIQILNELLINNKPSGLYNYKYVNGHGVGISAIFQDTLKSIQIKINKLNKPLTH